MKEGQSERLLQRYLKLFELSRDLASTLDLATLLKRIVFAAAELCNAQAASILLYDEPKKRLYFESTTNIDEPLMRGLIVPVENSIAGWIVLNRKPLIIADTQHDPRHFAGIGQATQVTTDSLMGVPLIAREKVIGALEVINKKESVFDTEDQDILMGLGLQAALAIENTLLFQQSDMIRELVHEVRTPLTSLNTAARLLGNPQVPEEMRKQMIEIISRETNRLSELTTSYLDLARLESGRVHFKPQCLDLLPLFEECAHLMQTKAEEKGIFINVHVDDSLPELVADRDKIKQVMINLLSNAIKYNRENGKVFLSAGVVGGELLISVRDTGNGIPPEHLPHLFEKFYRVPGSESKAQGTGLGLSIVKKIIEGHNGRIEAQSEVGVGTTFNIFLPVRESN